MKNSNATLKLQNKAQGAAVLHHANEMHSLFISWGIYKSGKTCKMYIIFKVKRSKINLYIGKTPNF